MSCSSLPKRTSRAGSPARIGGSARSSSHTDDCPGGTRACASSLRRLCAAHQAPAKGSCTGHLCSCLQGCRQQSICSNSVEAPARCPAACLRTGTHHTDPWLTAAMEVLDSLTLRPACCAPHQLLAGPGTGRHQCCSGHVQLLPGAGLSVPGSALPAPADAAPVRTGWLHRKCRSQGQQLVCTCTPACTERVQAAAVPCGCWRSPGTPAASAPPACTRLILVQGHGLGHAVAFGWRLQRDLSGIFSAVPCTAAGPAPGHRSATATLGLARR